jgi:folate-binding protein YgfZ
MGVLSLTGNDVVDFLQRMSTNDMTAIRHSESSCVTILTSEKARIIDLVRIINADGSFLLLSTGGNQMRVMEWLKKYIIMEDIQITDVTSLYSTSFFIIPDGINQSPDTLLRDRPSETHVFRDDLWHVPAFWRISRTVTDPSTENDVFAKISDEIYESLRIEQGIPALAHELTDQVNPLEAGLDRFVSFTKGCYIGQEVIARIDTYSKLRKRLTGMVFEFDTNVPPAVGKLFGEDDEVGFTTSHTWSYMLNQYISLGYIRCNFEGTDLTFEDVATQGRSRVRLSNLPFVEGWNSFRSASL